MSHIEQFCESAIAKGDGTSSNDHEYFESMKESIRNLADYSELLPLLKHKNDWVVCWSASHLLATEHKSKAIKALNALIHKGGVSGFSAEIVVQEYERGSFVSPLVQK
jgi:hypothetical protein